MIGPGSDKNGSGVDWVSRYPFTETVMVIRAPAVLTKKIVYKLYVLKFFITLFLPGDLKLYLYILLGCCHFQ